jgi:hypothetical protein
MSRTRTLILAGVAVAAVCCATCAPVDDPSPPKTDPFNKDPKENPPPPGPVVLPVGPGRNDLIRQRLETALDNVRQRDLLTTHGFWTVFHGILGLGPSLELLDPETQKRVNALDYICKGGQMRGLEFLITEHGLDVRTGSELFVAQGHQDQFIAEMAQWGIPADRKFAVGGKEFTFMDFVHHSQMRARTTQKQELSWAIVVIGQYLGTDVSWTNGAGEKLHFEDLVRYELDQSVEKAACGGTHRLFGLSWAYHLHLRKGGKTAGVWKDVADKTAEYQKLARKLRNADGSFSTDFFRGRGTSRDPERRINTSGHIFEWLALSLPDAELRADWVEEAANAVAMMLLEVQGQAVDGGSLYHAAHGLYIYHARLFDRGKLTIDGFTIPLPAN